MMVTGAYLQIAILVDENVTRFLPGASVLGGVWQPMMYLLDHDVRHRQNAHI